MNYLLRYYPKMVYELKHLNKYNSINNYFVQYFCQNNSNQRIITLKNNNQTNSEYNNNNEMSYKTKANICVTFVRNDGKRLTGSGKEGQSLLDVVVDNDIDLDGFGACEGTLACSTCHLIFKKQDFDRLPNRPVDEELDMLDLAFELTDTSRLGCQVIVDKDMDGLEVRVPNTVNDVRSN